MKKILLTMMAVIGLSAAADAQLKSGSVFPNYTTHDIYGNVIDVYALVNSGKTVFIDISATWCGPCWSYHMTHALDSLWAHHGPTGAPGVSATTTNDVAVIFVQGETGSGLAELTFNKWGSGAQNVTFNHTNYTQGDWTDKTSYYIVDDSTAQGTWNSLWNIAYFPTVYMICRDHLVYELTQPSESVAYAAAQAGCPGYAPSTTVDAKATAYTGTGAYICNATPTISFQNYSTGTLTAATINVTDGSGAIVHTEPWTGSLAPYAVTNVALTSFAGTSFGGYKYSVVAAGDTYPANNTSADSAFKIYGPTNAAAIPASEDFEGSMSYKYYFPDPKGLTIVSNTLVDPANTSASKDIIGVSGSKTMALWFDDYDASNGDALTNYTTSFIYGNYNINSNSNIAFDYSYSPKNSAATNSDKLEVLVSSDCGANWTAAWSASGTALATTAATTSKWFIPSAATQWKHATASLNAYKNADLMIKFAATDPSTAAAGMLVYVDNISFAITTAVPEVLASDEITVFPNPTRDNATVSLTLNESAKVSVEVIDALGRTVNNLVQELEAGSQKIDISTAVLPSGIYHVKITAGGFVTTKPLSVIK
jgi:hypothetical protein